MKLFAKEAGVSSHQPTNARDLMKLFAKEARVENTGLAVKAINPNKGSGIVSDVLTGSVGNIVKMARVSSHQPTNARDLVKLFAEEPRVSYAGSVGKSIGVYLSSQLRKQCCFPN